MRVQRLVRSRNASIIHIDAVGTNGLAAIEGRLRELRGEGPCQAPSLPGSNTSSDETDDVENIEKKYTYNGRTNI